MNVLFKLVRLPVENNLEIQQTANQQRTKNK